MIRMFFSICTCLFQYTIIILRILSLEHAKYLCIDRKKLFQIKVSIESFFLTVRHLVNLTVSCENYFEMYL